jgi:hypothetical protein
MPPPRPICSHSWIDPDDVPIARAPYVPWVGPRRREMKAGRLYRCNNCGDVMVAPSLRVCEGV